MKKYIFLIILTALFIRLYGSNYYPNFTMEECYQANQALEKYSLKSEQTDKNKYALYRIYYFLLNKLIVKSDFSAVSLKIVNALLSSLMVICFFLIGKKLGGETLGLFSSIILIFFPFHFINSRASGVVLHHSSFFVSLIFVYFIISFYFNRSLLYLIFSIIFACFAAVIHPVSSPLIISSILIISFIFYRNKFSNKNMIMIGSGILFLILLLLFIYITAVMDFKIPTLQYTAVFSKIIDFFDIIFLLNTGFYMFSHYSGVSFNPYFCSLFSAVLFIIIIYFSYKFNKNLTLIFAAGLLLNTFFIGLLLKISWNQFLPLRSHDFRYYVTNIFFYILISGSALNYLIVKKKKIIIIIFFYFPVSILSFYFYPFEKYGGKCDKYQVLWRGFVPLDKSSGWPYYLSSNKGNVTISLGRTLKKYIDINKKNIIITDKHLYEQTKFSLYAMYKLNIPKNIILFTYKNEGGYPYIQKNELNSAIGSYDYKIFFITFNSDNYPFYNSIIYDDTIIKKIKMVDVITKEDGTSLYEINEIIKQ